MSPHKWGLYRLVGGHFMRPRKRKLVSRHKTATAALKAALPGDLVQRLSAKERG